MGILIKRHSKGKVRRFYAQNSFSLSLESLPRRLAVVVF